MNTERVSVSEPRTLPSAGQLSGANSDHPRGSFLPSDPIAISIVSNSQLLREGLVMLLDTYIHVRLIGIYSGESHSGSHLQNPEGHIVLLDSGIGTDAAMTWTKWWRNLAPSARVLVLEIADDIETILACIEAGANGYTLKGASPAEVAQAIQFIQQGKTKCSPEITAQLFSRLAELSTQSPSIITSTPP